MTRPITIVTDVPEEQFNYSEDDATVLAAAVFMALKGYVTSGGDLEAWTIEAEPLELSEIKGIRLTLEGNNRD